MTGPRRFTVRGTNHGFTCAHCGAEVRPLANGSVRNHCPVCLYSLHVDVQPGDRASDCHGLLRPVGVEQSGKSGGDAFGHSTSGSSALGGAGLGSASAFGGYGGGSAEAGASGFGGDAGSTSGAQGALGGDVSDNTSIGSITINS